MSFSVYSLGTTVTSGPGTSQILTPSALYTVSLSSAEPFDAIMQMSLDNSGWFTPDYQPILNGAELNVNRLVNTPCKYMRIFVNTATAPISATVVAQN